MENANNETPIQSTATATTHVEPSELYKKARRYLVAHSGILILLSVIGIEEGTSLIGIKLSDVKLADIVFVVTVSYYFFQVSLFWRLQPSTVRRNIPYRIDYISCLVIAAAAIEIFIYWDALLSGWNLAYKVLLMVGIVLIVVISQFVSNAAVLFAREKEEDQRSALSSVLTQEDWIMIFNASGYRSPSGYKTSFKPISFDEDGMIGEGQNTNEYSWRTQDGLLEILNERGQVQSRFQFNSSVPSFVHTNDSDTLSLRDQALVTLENHIKAMESRGLDPNHTPIAQSKNRKNKRRMA